MLIQPKVLVTWVDAVPDLFKTPSVPLDIFLSDYISVHIKQRRALGSYHARTFMEDQNYIEIRINAEDYTLYLNLSRKKRSADILEYVVDSWREVRRDDTQYQDFNAQWYEQFYEERPNHVWSWMIEAYHLVFVNSDSGKYYTTVANYAAADILRVMRLSFMHHHFYATVPERLPMLVNPVFGSLEQQIDDDFCFILMPFVEDLAPVYTDHIKSVIENAGLTALRADDLFSASTIIEDIWKSILRARLIIADVTGKNPNVFYELGIAHTLGKDVIIITQSIQDVPFDIAHWRVLSYSFTPRGMNEFEEHLSKTINVILRKEQPVQK